MNQRDLLCSRIDHYYIKDCVGNGGFSWVYRALDLENQKYVILKILNPDKSENPIEVARSEREAKILSELDHPGIINIIGDAKLPPEKKLSHYLVLEDFPSFDLESWVGTGYTQRWSLSKKAGIILDTARALDYCHQKGFIHLDGKLANILYDGKKVKIIDFYLAKDLNRPELNVSRGRDNVVYGTAQFIPLELLSKRDCPASDIFSLGVIFYSLLKDRTLPFPGIEDATDAIRKLTEVPYPLHVGAKREPKQIQDILMGMTEPSAGDRPRADEVVSALKKIV
ncbi:serine/threonine protein kinase [Nanoarchaeota archaeon]